MAQCRDCSWTAETAALAVTLSRANSSRHAPPWPPPPPQDRPCASSACWYKGPALHYSPVECGLSWKLILPRKTSVITTSKLSACHFSTHICCALQEIFWAFKRPAIKDLCLVWVWFFHLSFSSLVTSSRNLPSWAEVLATWKYMKAQSLKGLTYSLLCFNITGLCN